MFQCILRHDGTQCKSRLQNSLSDTFCCPRRAAHTGTSYSLRSVEYQLIDPPLVSRARLDQILTEFWSKIAISKRKMRRGREKDGYYVGCYPGQNAFKKLVIWPKNGDHPLVSWPKASRGVNELVFYWLLWGKERVSLLDSRQSLLRSNNFFWWYCELVIELADWIIIFMSTMVRDEHRNWFVGISILLT